MGFETERFPEIWTPGPCRVNGRVARPPARSRWSDREVGPSAKANGWEPLSHRSWASRQLGQIFPIFVLG